MMAWVMIVYIAGYTNQSYSGGPLAVEFSSRDRCEAAAVQIAVSHKGRYAWHVCVQR